MTSSFTSSASSERLAARQWILEPGAAPAVPTPAEAVAKIMAGLAAVGEAQRPMIEPYLQMTDDAAVCANSIKHIVGFTPEPAWVAETTAELIRQGYTEQLARKVGLDARPPVSSAKAAEGSGSASQNRVKSDSASGTAVAAAYLRNYCHEFLGGGDSMARAIVPSLRKIERPEGLVARFKATGELPQSSVEAQKDGAMPCHVTYMQCRTCFLDDVILAFLKQHAGLAINAVFLGAGYDTRPYRMPDVWGQADVAFFEIDAATTQKAKLEALETMEPKTAFDHVTFVAVDFTGGENWLDKATAAGLDASRPTIVVWEGVVYYLPESAIVETLKIVAERFTGPAAIAFDFFAPETVALHGAETKKIGEPMVFGATGAKIEALAGDTGLRVLDLLRWNEMQARCMPLMDGKPVGNAPDWHGLAMLGARF